MSEQKKSHTNSQVILFVTVICFICALVLSLLASALKKPQERARELYKSKQLLIASRILSYDGHFLLKQGEKFVPAVYKEEENMLAPAEEEPPPSAKSQEILNVYQRRVHPMLTDKEGSLYTFEDLGIDPDDYMKEHAKKGFADLKYKLLYLISPNEPSDKAAMERIPYGYVIPVNGYGLWGPVYGYLTLSSDANHIIGTTWYDQEETPGLGGNIGLPYWQKQFYEKQIFQPNQEGTVNYNRAPLGVIIVKTSVDDELKGSPKAQSAVDGIPGATITVKGVTEAYRSSLSPYRQFLIRAHERYVESVGGKDEK